MSSPIPIHITGLKPDKPVNLFTYAALTADDDGKVFTKPENFRYGETLVNNFSANWTLSSYSDAALLVYAHPFTKSDELRRLSQHARESEKPLIFLETSESEPPSELSHGRVYRQSIFGIQRGPDEYAAPSMHPDSLADRRIESVPVLPKENQASVGFCGFVGRPSQTKLFRLLGQKQKADGLEIRGEALRAFEGSRDINCRFIRRSQYLGLATLAMDRQNSLFDQRNEFLDNLFSCPYGVAVRGKGNHSVRFYELLSAGRIPIFINTDCVLPFQDTIDYKKHTVWIEYEDLGRAREILLDFHQGTTNEEFEHIQKSNRDIWEEFLSPLGFHKKVVVPS